MQTHMTREQKDDLISTVIAVLFVGSFLGIIGYNAYSLFEYNRAEKQKTELKQKQAIKDAFFIQKQESKVR